jgi:hypothetical protein
MVSKFTYMESMRIKLPQRCCFCSKPEVYDFVKLKPQLATISVPYCLEHYNAAELIRKKPPRGYVWMWAGGIALFFGISIPVSLLLYWLIGPVATLFILGWPTIIPIIIDIGPIIARQLEKSLKKTYSREIILDMQSHHGYKDSVELAGSGINKKNYTLGFSIQYESSPFYSRAQIPYSKTYRFSNPEYAKEFLSINKSEEE